MTALLGGDAIVESRSGFVRFWHRRPAADLQEWELLRAAIESEIGLTGGRLLIDSRESAYTPPDVQTAIWSWLQGHEILRRVAALVESENLAVSLRMQGIAKGVQLKAFDNEPEAEAWLAT